MNDKNNDVNWEIVQEASREAVRTAKKKFSRLSNIDSDELQNELICFILADTPRSRKFNRYTKGDTTKEKLSKLIYSLNTDRSWLNNFFPSVPERYENDVITVGQVDASTAKEIVKKVFSGDTIESEAFYIIADKLVRSLSKSQKDVLYSVYSNPTLSKKQIAIDHCIGWRHVYKLIAKANEIAEREWLPLYIGSRGEDEMAQIFNPMNY